MPFNMGASAHRYWIIIAVLAGLATLLITGPPAWDSPLLFGMDGFWLIARRRLDTVVAMIMVACCHAVAIMAFQSIVNNRIITPSIMGFEALCVAISTIAVYFFGATGLMTANSVGAFVLQLILIAGLSLALYAWLPTGQGAGMHSTLLVGIVIGGGLTSLSASMQHMLTPSDFDLLMARLFGSVNDADPGFFPVATPLMAVAIVVTALYSRVLSIMSLGREVTTNLGVDYQVRSIAVLVATAVPMAASTAMIGPVTFLGFLAATIAYQTADTYDYHFTLPMATLIGYVIPASAYFILNHAFYAQSVVFITIELIGGPVSLYVVLKKGRL